MLNFIAEHGSINVTQAVRLCGVEWGTAKKELIRLEQLGIVARMARTDIERDPKAVYVFANLSDGPDIDSSQVSPSGSEDD